MISQYWPTIVTHVYVTGPTSVKASVNDKCHLLPVDIILQQLLSLYILWSTNVQLCHTSISSRNDGDWPSFLKPQNFFTFLIIGQHSSGVNVNRPECNLRQLLSLCLPVTQKRNMRSFNHMKTHPWSSPGTRLTKTWDAITLRYQSLFLFFHTS